MPNLEELLLKRQTAPEGPQLPQAPPNLPSLGQKVFEGGIDTILGLLGVGPDTQPNQIGQMMGAAAPMFRVGGKVLKRVGNSWQWLDDSQSARVNTKLDKKFETPQTARQIEEVKDVAPPINRASAPKPSGKWNRGASSYMSRSKLNQSMAMDIRKRGQAGESIDKLAEEYEITRSQARDIVLGNSWNWVR